MRTSCGRDIPARILSDSAESVPLARHVFAARVNFLKHILVPTHSDREDLPRAVAKEVP